MEEWNGLMVAVGGVKKTETEDMGGEKITITYHEVAGKKLKSKGGWDGNDNGTDEFGFSALPGGDRYDPDGSFGNAGYHGYWWSATENDADLAYYRGMSYDYDGVGEDSSYKSEGFSVRCVGVAQD
jgi:uncharacterized protein (TIGR02145 family)